MPIPRLAPGMEIDGFRLVDMVHKGGMARLWSVTRGDLPFPALMKVPMMGAGDDPAAIVSFEMEQMILPRLAGPHVPQFVANGDFATHPYIIMERIAGQSLYPMLNALPRPLDELAALGAKVAIALDSLHRQHVVHLDLKPSNIMFRQSGEAVLIDYGLARHTQLPDLMGEEFRLPYGTAPYMAPEQVMGTRFDYRSDIFALGALLYFFATGKRPFGDPQKLKGLKKRLWRDPWPPRKLRPDMPPAFQEIIMRCLEVNPAWRYPTAAHLAVDLQDLSHVKLTARADKLNRDPWTRVLQRRFNPDRIEIAAPVATEVQIENAPIVMVAIDLASGCQDLAEALLNATARILENTGNARLACVNILKINRIALDSSLDESGNNKHVQRLVELKNWAANLRLPEGSVTFHVLEAVSPADAILHYARNNLVDHIVMGARAASAMRSLLGSVSAEVASNAPCTVTVVRSRVTKNEDASR
jgi:eukaryotic-like serine/threonine-protein kinase